MICTYNLSTRNNVKNIQVSTCDKFDPCGNGGKFWQELYENGCFTQRIDDGVFKGISVISWKKLNVKVIKFQLR